MSGENTASPYDAAIADLQSRIQHLQAMLDGMLQLRAQYTGAPVPAVTTASRQIGGEKEVLHDSFFGMTIGDGAKKYLSMVKATKSTGEIADALERGGLKHASKDFNTTVRSVLGGREDFLRVNGDWGLTEWYPGMRREKKVKAEKLQPAQQKSQHAKKGPQVVPEKPPSSGTTRKELILKTMQTDPGKGLDRR